ncbi:Gfo/Idh/MocA family oxidoreductase [Fontisphaera persica]|uniref:Gfo/Idh/MocA family protein n=1 Tax=Fontisphaera persica TaxID=2974023 RepID=UPI0024C0CC11|nr:Gfo/Idh/MocA family oxidoreductase [Fontisphaera persica]WCJ58552.1 Gfo/Idh/MocA family oxidoreductase [Fontisphaera persica]
MAERLRCAVIGAGVAGAEWVARLTRGPRTTVVALCDAHPQRARELQERYRIPRLYASFEEAVEQPDLDAVVVAAPNHLHAPITLAALKARKHVLVETPLALNAKEATRLVETAQAMKCLLMPAQELRFNRASQLARACLHHGELGEVFHARAWWRRHQWPRPGTWRAQRNQSGGGCLVDLGQPLVDLLLYLLNDFQVAQVYASGQILFGPHTNHEPEPNRAPAPVAGIFDVEDTGTACLVLKNNRWLNIETSWGGHFQGDEPEQGVEILGTKASLRLFPARLYRQGNLGMECILLNALKPSHPEDCGQHFAQCVLENKKPLITPAEMLAVQRVVDGIVVAAASGKPVPLKP